MGRSIRAELYKMKHTMIPYMHIFPPLLYAMSVYLAYRYTGVGNFSANELTKNYLTILGSLIPVLIGFVTAEEADLESDAGHFQFVLAEGGSRVKIYLSKLFTLLLCGAGFVALAVIAYAVLLQNQRVYDALVETAMLSYSSLSIYLIHLWAGFTFGGAVSIGIGFSEMLLAFLAMTNLGDPIWYFLPCTWPARASTTYLLGKTGFGKAMAHGELLKWCTISISVTILLIIASILWICLWNGRSNTE